MIRPFLWGLLPRRSRSEAELARRAAAIVPAAAAGLIALADRLGAEIRPTAVVERAASPPQRPGTTVTLLDERGLRAHVWIDGALAGAVAARLLGAAPPDEIEAPRPASAVERGLLAYAVAFALEVIGAPLLVEEVTDGSPALAGTVVAVDLAVHIAPARGFVRIYAPPALLATPVRPWAELVTARLPTLPVTVRALAGRARVNVTDRAKMRPRSVVRLDRAPGGLYIAAGSGGFLARRVPGGALLTHPFAKGNPMAERDELARDLPVELSCEIARLVLPAHEVLGLGPGAILPLGKRPGDPVELLAAGRLIARGELVDVDGEVGVRVTEIL